MTPITTFAKESEKIPVNHYNTERQQIVPRADLYAELQEYNDYLHFYVSDEHVVTSLSLSLPFDYDKELVKNTIIKLADQYDIDILVYQDLTEISTLYIYPQQTHYFHAQDNWKIPSYETCKGDFCEQIKLFSSNTEEIDDFAKAFSKALPDLKESYQYQFISQLSTLDQSFEASGYLETDSMYLYRNIKRDYLLLGAFTFIFSILYYLKNHKRIAVYKANGFTLFHIFISITKPFLLYFTLSSLLLSLLSCIFFQALFNLHYWLFTIGSIFLFILIFLLLLAMLCFVSSKTIAIPQLLKGHIPYRILSCLNFITETILLALIFAEFTQVVYIK